MPYKSNTKQQMNTLKKSVDINKNKLKMLQDEQDNLNKKIKQDERKFKLYEFMDNNNFTEEEVIEIFGLEQLEETPHEEEFRDVRGDIPDDAENISDNAENIPDSAVDTSEDEYTEVSDIEGPINSSMCDEIVDLEFSNNGIEANKQLVKRLLQEQDINIIYRDNNRWLYIKKNNNKLTMENFNNGRQEHGLLTSNKYTPLSDIVNNWERYGNRKSKRKKYDFKGKNIEEVVQMIHDILG